MVALTKFLPLLAATVALAQQDESRDDQCEAIPAEVTFNVVDGQTQTIVVASGQTLTVTDGQSVAVIGGNTVAIGNARNAKPTAMIHVSDGKTYTVSATFAPGTTVTQTAYKSLNDPWPVNAAVYTRPDLMVVAAALLVMFA